LVARGPPPQVLREYAGLDDEAVRREVFQEHEPTILRGFVAEWPAVRGARSPDDFVRYLRRFDNGNPVDALLLPAEMGGRIFYNETMSGFNFIRNRLPLSAVAEQVLRYARFPHAPSVAAQSALIRDCLPGFEAANPLRAVAAAVAPRIWLGTRITTPTHVDEWNNIGCVVAGRRRFTLFPPDQLSNLYIGPLDFAPTGAAMSLVSLSDPDFARYPKFRAALDTARTGDLGPGDAIYIPPLWWHHVESLEPFNVLVNYWWHAAGGANADSAFDALLHGILSIRNLPPETRRAWAALFEHYIFAPHADALAHIPAQRHGILGNLTPERSAELRVHLAKKLARDRTDQ
jgi:hypothetical protein